MFVELEKLGEDMHTLEAVGLQRRGSASVHSAAIRGTRDIFNKARIGKSEVEFVQTMIDGVTKLIELEKEPETGESYTDVLARVSTRKPHMEAVSSRWSEAKRVSQSSRRFPRGY
jgi:creatine kinase